MHCVGFLVLLWQFKNLPLTETVKIIYGFCETEMSGFVCFIYFDKQKHFVIISLWDLE